MRELSSQKVRGAAVLTMSVPGAPGSPKTKAGTILPSWGDLPPQHLFSPCELGPETLGAMKPWELCFGGAAPPEMPVCPSSALP